MQKTTVVKYRSKEAMMKSKKNQKQNTVSKLKKNQIC